MNFVKLLGHHFSVGPATNTAVDRLAIFYCNYEDGTLSIMFMFYIHYIEIISMISRVSIHLENIIYGIYNKDAKVGSNFLVTYDIMSILNNQSLKCIFTQ